MIRVKDEEILDWSEAAALLNISESALKTRFYREKFITGLLVDNKRYFSKSDVLRHLERKFEQLTV